MLHGSIPLILAESSGWLVLSTSTSDGLLTTGLSKMQPGQDVIRPYDELNFAYNLPIFFSCLFLSLRNGVLSAFLNLAVVILLLQRPDPTL